MASLIFGLVAALAWGLHDFFVRDVSQRAPAGPLLFVVLLAGSVMLAPLTLLAGDWSRMSPATTATAFAAGFAYTAGSVGLYRAFSIGPVRLVAPICGAYPVLSVGWAALSGQPIGAAHWLAVLAVIGGIALVARQSGDTAAPDRPLAAIGWSLLAAAGFALTFALGQLAARSGSELPATLVTRLGALAVVGAWLLATRRTLAPARPFLPVLALMGLLDVAALGFVLAAGGLPHPEFAAVTSSIFGMVTILLAWRFLGEGMRPVQWTGVGVVFTGIAYLAAT